MITYIVQYKVCWYEGHLPSLQEKSFNNLLDAAKLRNRINRYIDWFKKMNYPYIGEAYNERRDLFSREMTDNASFYYTQRAHIIERTTEDKEII